jgi:hypothetical protein
MRLLSVGSTSASSVFDLLGQKENDLTFAIGWCLRSSDAFLRRFVGLAGLSISDLSSVELHLQHYDRDDERVGITDIEIRANDLHLIVEAKRGWELPTREQLGKYASILRRSEASERRFVVLTRWGAESAAVIAQALGAEVAGFPISAVGVSDVVREARSALAEERGLQPRLYLKELLAYLEGGGYVGSHRDSRVYVVPLSKGLSEINVHLHRIPYERNLYWYGLTGGPKMPPNYVGFRFDGKLQSIHHVEESTPFARFRDLFPETTKDWGPGVKLMLGPPIHPGKEVRSGKLRDRRVWADIDLLLTSSTVEDAARLTKERDQREAAR